MPKFEYEWRDTPIHRMHVIPKLAVFATLASITTVWMDPRYLAVMLVISVSLFLVAKVPRKWLWMPVLFAIGSRWRTFLMQVPFMTDPGLYKVYDPVWASQMLVDIGTVPIFGHLAYTRGSIVWFLGGVMSFIILAIFANTLYYTTNIADISHYLTKAKLPSMVTFTFFVVFRFMPVMLKLSTEVTNSLKGRGWEMNKTRNPVTFARNMFVIMNPVCRQFMRTVDVVTLSVVNRAFGANPIRPHKEWPISRTHIIASVLIVLLFFVFYYLAIVPPFYGNI
jgi:energy-coupling factor transporter transmembrane protein EcfT